jgi:hypothetical protein
MMFYDHFGSIASDRLLTMMRFMAASGCKFIVLDHISIVTLAASKASEDERKDIDILMTGLGSFTQETGCGVYRRRPSEALSRARTSTRAATSASMTYAARRQSSSCHSTSSA